ncbi:MAG: GNAT family N-acetyltransferase [Acidobacteria bacterium]|nr:GNAT family N-acetyltransferase [Acidobacteriota bacterium]
MSEPSATVADLVLRPMRADDIEIVASLHVASWRTAYRGIFTDVYLDTVAGTERRAHWTRRLATPVATHTGVVAEQDGVPVGFCYLIADADPPRGTLLDNLHVAPGARGAGLGRRLLACAAEEIAARHWPRGLHLWVFDANTGARRFYERHGAQVVDRTVYSSADGGANAALCYAWPDAAVLRLP